MSFPLHRQGPQRSERREVTSPRPQNTHMPELELGPRSIQLKRYKDLSPFALRTSPSPWKRKNMTALQGEQRFHSKQLLIFPRENLNCKHIPQGTSLTRQTQPHSPKLLVNCSPYSPFWNLSHSETVFFQGIIIFTIQWVSTTCQSRDMYYFISL